MLKTIRVRTLELGLWFRHGDLYRVLEPGVYRVPNVRPWSRRDHIEVVDTLRPRFSHERLRALVSDQRLASRLTIVDLKDDERALVWIDGRLGAILSSGLHAFWSAPATVEVERYSVNDGRFVHPKLEAILAYPGGSSLLGGLRVDSHERVMLYRDGELVDELGPGLFVYWKGGASITWKSVDLREQVADIQGQEIMTADKVTLRMNLVVTHRVTDAVRAVTEVGDWEQSLYREAQLELRTAVGGRTLEQLLSTKDEVGSQIRNRLSARAAEFGVAVSGVGLRDVILPGDMKVILNEVIVAQKQAEANLIRRREETAAVRSQANTAKLLADNPQLSRLRELEALQEILKGAKTTFVIGSGQGSLGDQVTRLLRSEAESAGA
ncbi:MAG: slipin family protein [Phycisphaerales bacterium]|nr:slipin family protein [Phycisphaerales bacterium]